MNTRVLSEYRQLVGSLSGEGTHFISEDYLVLRVKKFRCPDVNVWNILKKFVQSIIDEQMGSCIVSGEIFLDIDIDETDYEQVEGDIYTLVVKKAGGDGFYFFFTEDGFARSIDNDEFVNNAREVWIASNFWGFSSLTTSFQEWGIRNALKDYHWVGQSNPRKISRDLSTNSSYRVPNDIRPWIMPEQDAQDSMVLESWKIAASKKLAMSLPTEVRVDDINASVTFRGDKIREVKISEDDSSYLGSHSILNKCALWIFSAHQDAETKHTLLNYHLATEWVGDDEWPDNRILEKAFYSADETFKLHMHRSAQELLKAYGEIKKSLQDEVNKFAADTKGLVSNLWRDFAVAAGVLALNFAVQSSRLTAEGLKIIFMAVAIFLMLSITVTVFSNEKYNQIFKKNREMWRERLYPFINDQSFSKLMNDPIKDSLKVYSRVVWVTAIVYIIISGYLVYLAIEATSG